MTGKINWRNYEIKTLLPKSTYPICCELCNGWIKVGEVYYDGGFCRRVHLQCVDGGREMCAECNRFMPQAGDPRVGVWCNCHDDG